MCFAINIQLFPVSFYDIVLATRLAGLCLIYFGLNLFFYGRALTAQYVRISAAYTNYRHCNDL